MKRTVFIAIGIAGALAASPLLAQQPAGTPRNNLASTQISAVQIPGVPAPAGHYSPAVAYDGLVFVAGQLPIDPRTGEKKLGSIEEQTEQALGNVSEILKAANSDLSRTLKVTIYISDIKQWGAVNTIYAKVVGNHKPARSVVPTKDLHYGALVEIEAIAAVNP